MPVRTLGTTGHVAVVVAGREAEGAEQKRDCCDAHVRSHEACEKNQPIHRGVRDENSAPRTSLFRLVYSVGVNVANGAHIAWKMICTHATVFDQVADQGGTVATSLSATGLLATAGGGDSRVKLWNVATGQQVVELTTSAPATAPIAFSPDGSYLVYNDGGVLRRYLMDVDRLIELAKSRLTRGLTADECRRHLDASQCA